MAVNINTGYGTSNQTITCGLGTLASAASRQSTVIDSTVNKPLDALVCVKVKSGASGTAATGYVNVYVYASVDGGTTYTDNASGSDSAITLTVPPNLILLGQINVVANGVTYVGGPWSVAEKFGGSMPAKWGIAVENQSGHALDTTAGNHVCNYQEIFETAA